MVAPPYLVEVDIGGVCEREWTDDERAVTYCEGMGEGNDLILMRMV